jgi:hypothetical protein
VIKQGVKVVDGLPDDVSTEGMNFQNKCLDKMMEFKKRVLLETHNILPPQTFLAQPQEGIQQASF